MASGGGGGASGTIQESKIAEQDARRSKMMALYQRHVTPSTYFVEVKEKRFPRTPPSPPLPLVTGTEETPRVNIVNKRYV